MTNPIEQWQFSRENGRIKTVALDELHSIFIQNVSHELRTPLSIMQGYAELLFSGELGELTPEQDHAVAAIVDRTHELRTMVERIGILLAAQAHETVSVPLSVAGVVADVVESRRTAAQEASLTLDVNLESDLPLVIGDPFQLQPAIDCLLDNAIKFTPGGGRIELQAYTEPGWVCLVVADTGIGMSREEMDHIFTPFYQIDGSTTRRYSGMGLGLGIVKTVIQGHNGQVSVASHPGEGSSFTVKLPTISSKAQPDSPAVDDARPRRILVVDDEVNVALTIQDGLEKLPNCQVTISTSGEGALELFEQSPFDLLITDYKMPGTDGLTLSTRVRQLYPDTSIIMITAYSSHLLQRQATENSIERILDKPVKLDEIRSVALEALEICG